ncbi:MAG: M24 family metallopeptidase, partial [Bdellovibrionales bacterium]|nr:M24 family metallopeptidase [Bdellovibrionales bacterium]
MDETISIKNLVEAMVEEGVEAWLFYDFRGSDPLAASILGLDPNRHSTRRWFYLVTAKGVCKKLSHRIEVGTLAAYPGELEAYASWEELQAKLQDMLKGISAVAMQYSPQGEIPYVSYVDAGTIELIQSCGVQVISSGDLVQRIQASIDEEGYQSHCLAGEKISRIVEEAFAWTAQQINEHGSTDEFSVQSFILKRFLEEGLETYCPPIVAVGPNSSNPHYLPDHKQKDFIRNGD